MSKAQKIMIWILAIFGVLYIAPLIFVVISLFGGEIEAYRNAKRETSQSTLEAKLIPNIYEPRILIGRREDNNNNLSIIEQQIRNPGWLYKKDGSESIFLKTNLDKEIEIRTDKNNSYAILAPRAKEVVILDEKNKVAVFINLLTGKLERFKGEMEDTSHKYQDNRFQNLCSLNSEKVFVYKENEGENPSGNLIDFDNKTIMPIKEQDFLEKFEWNFREIDYSVSNYKDLFYNSSFNSEEDVTFAEFPKDNRKFYSPEKNFYYTIENINYGLCIDSCNIMHRITVYSKNGNELGKYINTDWIIPFAWSKDEKSIYLSTFLSDYKLKESKEERRGIYKIEL
jgi:hypothetical protein